MKRTVTRWMKKQSHIFQVFLPDKETPFDDTRFLAFLFLILKLISWKFKIYCRQYHTQKELLDMYTLEDMLKTIKVKTPADKPQNDTWNTL